MQARELAETAASAANPPQQSVPESTAQMLQRIERLGKHLFGVAVCLLRLDVELAQRLDWLQESSAHAFSAAQSVEDNVLQILPTQSSPFQPALGRVDQFDVRFYLSHPLRNSSGHVIGVLALIHDRPRAFTAGDRILLDDLLALIQRQLH